MRTLLYLEGLAQVDDSTERGAGLTPTYSGLCLGYSVPDEL